jgi:glutaredoxin
MNPTLDVLSSTLTSSLRFWRGTSARAATRQPKKHLELYEFEACPFCRLVREALTEIDLDALIYPSPHGGKRFRPKVVKLGGKQQFPFLVDPNSGESLYESADIIDYLYRQYGGGRAPTRLLRPLDVASSALASLPRQRRATAAPWPPAPLSAASVSGLRRHEPTPLRLAVARRGLERLPHRHVRLRRRVRFPRLATCPRLTPDNS